MTIQRAIQIKNRGEAELVFTAPIPRMQDNFILVKTVAVGLNPTDWMHIDDIRATPGSTVGCDYSGIVEQVGVAVKSDIKAGDRVAGVVHGSSSDDLQSGSFAEYVVAKDGLFLKIPDCISFEEAATLGVGITTIGQGMYQSLGLPLTFEPIEEDLPTSILIYGGSTATGTLAIQFAKLSGLQVVTTCSPRNFELVHRLGADYVLDYSLPGCASAIREITQNRLRYAFDTISTPSTVAICAEAIGLQGGKYSSLLPNLKWPRCDVSNGFTSLYTAFGETYHKFGREVAAKPSDYRFATQFWKLAAELLREGKLKPHPPDIREGALAGILSGLQDMREKKVSGVKLVYHVR